MKLLVIVDGREIALLQQFKNTYMNLCYKLIFYYCLIIIWVLFSYSCWCNQMELVIFYLMCLRDGG